MNILKEIIAHKRLEVMERKKLVSVIQLEQQACFRRTPLSLAKNLRSDKSSGIIAEFKRKSPSKGIIHADIAAEKIAVGYERAGASGLSILTDTRYFGGSLEDLEKARAVTSCPILRKDFIVDEYQLYEARAIGADVILLIAAALEPAQIRSLCSTAHDLGMEVLLEVHNEKELNDNLKANADLIGVNNRNLKTFEVTIETSKRLSRLISGDVVKVSESGIESPETILELRTHGFSGFLIGQTFMEQKDPAGAAAEFIQRLNMKRDG